MRTAVSYARRDFQLLEPLFDALRNEGLQVVLDASEPVAAPVLKIREAEVVIAILGEVNDARVFFDLGIAEALGKPVIIAVHANTSVPHDFRSIRYVGLSEDVSIDASEIVRAVKEVRSKMKDHYIDTKKIIKQKHDDIHWTETEPVYGTAFENLVAKRFLDLGCDVEAPFSLGQNFGVDMVVHSSKFKQPLLVECKSSWNEKLVSVATVQHLLMQLARYGSRNGAIVSSGGFTSSAAALAARAGVFLLTLQQLAESKSQMELFESEGNPDREHAS